MENLFSMLALMSIVDTTKLTYNMWPTDINGDSLRFLCKDQSVGIKAIPFRSVPFRLVSSRTFCSCVRLCVYECRCLNQFQFINFYNQLILSILWRILKARTYSTLLYIDILRGKASGILKRDMQRKFDCQTHVHVE